MFEKYFEWLCRSAKKYLTTFAALALGLCAVLCFLQFSVNTAWADDGDSDSSDLNSLDTVPLASASIDIVNNTASIKPLADTEDVAFAVYSTDDHSLVFYADEAVPSKGDKYNGKTVTDVFTGFDSTRYSSASGQPWKNYRSDIYSVVADESFSVIQPIGMRYWFYGLENCSDFDLANIDTSQVNNMSYLFVSCGSIRSLNLSNWDTANVQTMYSMFHQCYNLNSVNLDGFDTSAVTTFGYMFYQCRSLTSVDVSMFNTSKATYLSDMFYDCESLSTIDVSNFNTSAVTSMVSTFQKCTNLKHLDLSGWDTSCANSCSSFLKDDSKLSDITVGDNFTLFEKSTSALTDIQTWYDVIGNVVSDNYLIGKSLSAGTYYTYGIDFSDMDAEIVGSETDESTWTDSESVNVNEAIEIEMSTTLPTLHTGAVADGEYNLTFHNKLDTGLDIDSLESDFKVEIDGVEINTAYYSIDISNNATTFDGGFSSLNITALDDGCTFHVDVDLSALYQDGVITDDDFGTANVRVFFYVSLEDVDDVNTSYANTIWYDINDSGNVIHTSDPVYVEVYTFEIDINKIDTETAEALAEAVFGLYSDESCTVAVQKSGENYVITTNDNGYAQFRGIATGTYWVKEIVAPDGYQLSDTPYRVTVALDATGMNEHIYTLDVEDEKAIIDISDPDSGITVTVDIPADGYAYDGTYHEPTVTLTDKDGNELVYGTDYTVKYTNNKDAGTATVTVEGIGNYEGVVDTTFSIVAAEITKDDISGIDDVYEHTGSQITPVPTVVVGGNTLTKDVDYTVSYGDNTDAGVGSVTVEGCGNYTGTVEIAFTIGSEGIDGAEITIDTPAGGFVYDGTYHTPVVSVTVHGIPLEEGIDYRVKYTDNKDAGTATIYVITTGDNYSGFATATFDIAKADATIDVNSASKMYGESDPEFTGSVTGLVHSDDLGNIVCTRDAGEDVGEYTIGANYTDNSNYNVTINVGTFTIEPADLVGEGEIEVVGQCSYIGSEITPEVEVYDHDGNLLVEGRDYTVSCKNNINAGSATVIVSGCGNYTGSLEATFVIRPAEITDENISGIDSSYDFTRSAIRPVPVVVVGKTTLVENTDYTVSYGDNTEVGTGTVTVEGIGNYEGEIEVVFEIVDSGSSPIEITQSMFDVDTSYGIYDGYTPVTKKIESDLVLGADYTVSYENNNAAGNAMIIIEGMGNYYGSLEYSFKIIRYFEDIGAYVTDANNWYFDAVYGLVDKNVITGYNQTIFGVGDNLSRADLVTILWRYLDLDGYATYNESDAVNTTGLPDVEDGTYWTGAANWAVANGIVTGYQVSDGSYIFAPYDSVTFDQLVTILARYNLGFAGAETYPTSVLDEPRFTDGDEVEAWAAGSMSWAIDNEVVTGNANANGTYTIAPLDDVARERACTVLWRCIGKGII